MSMIVNSIKMFYNKNQLDFLFFMNHIISITILYLGYQGMGNSCYIANPINNTTTPLACFLSYSPGNKSSNNLFVPSNTLKKM